MNLQKSVTVIGGGIAGLSAAVFLKKKDFKVSIIEASPKLGGRAYSFFDKDKNQFFDNGQHILAGWYKNTFEYLKIIGSYNKLHFQRGLEVNFINTKKELYKLQCPDFEPPMNLLLGLLNFKAFDVKDKFSLKNIYGILKENDFESKYENVRELLSGINQTENLMKYFWEPFVLAVFNTRLENVSAKVFMNVMKISFKEKTNSTLVIPNINLNELLIDDAVKLFEANDAELIVEKRVTQIITNEEEPQKVEFLVLENGEKIFSDFYISAVPFFAFKKLFEAEIYNKNEFKSELLKTSSIVSIHIFLNEEIPEEMIPHNSFGMTGLIDTVVQWVFKRSGTHLSLVISGADERQITGMSNEDIFSLCLRDLTETIAGFENLKISDYKIIKEKRATFIPDYNSSDFRPDQRTRYKNFFIAGDWTNTGMPATIESAVTSGKICSELVVSS